MSSNVLSPHTPRNPRSPTISSAALQTDLRALAAQVELELGDGARIIEEMADLCDQLLDSDSSSKLLADSIDAFVRAIDTYLKGPLEGQILSEKVIGCLRKANILLPDLYNVSIVLARSLLNRLYVTPTEDGYKEGMAMLDKVITFRDPENRPSPDRKRALDLAAQFARSQFNLYGKPEYLEQAIYLTRALLDGTSLEDPLRPWIIKEIPRLERLRFDNVGVTTKVQGALCNTSGSANIPPYRALTASLAELNTVKPLSIMTLMKHRNALKGSTIRRLTDMMVIEDGIKYCQQLLTSYTGVQPIQLLPYARAALCRLFYRAYRCTKKVEYLNKAISAARDDNNTAVRAILRMTSLVTLISFLRLRLDLLDRREDVNELMELFPLAANLENVGSFHRFPLSCHWASIARRSGHPSASTAYDRAMSLMQASLTFAPTLDKQHSRLVAMRDGFKTLPLDYASYQIHTGQLEQAVETLERGRVSLWSEMRGLRTTIDQIRLADSHLADKFAEVNRDLETLALAFSPNNSDDGDLEGMDRYSHLMRHQKLLDDRKELISQIQALPGFDTFLRPASFDTLCSAACYGPVIIINHCEWRCDIVILLHNSPPSLITTSDDFYRRANRLQHRLLGKRKEGLESKEYEDALRYVLQELYEIVGRPVIKRLNELNVPEQSHVWWCPTSVFCSLPLHAMGPIRSDGDCPQYFLDLYIPSYTPSLSALIGSHKPGPQTIIGKPKPSILLVARANEKMPKALKEMKAVQAVDTQVMTLYSSKATPAATLAHLRDHSFAHIVCHGVLEPGRPFEASFKLFRGNRLPLLDIVRSQLPDAEFAFLSACHTAELTEESVADEVLHLAAAMQFCGFRSVVGTMWAMADIDGRDLARYFYDSVFSDEAQGTRYYERTAAALRDAVQKLRRKGGITFERWVNFVHYGA